MFEKSIYQRRQLNRKVRKPYVPAWPVVWIVNVLLIGSLILAVIDEDSRSAFVDLTQVGLGGYIALIMPRQEKE